MICQIIMIERGSIARWCWRATKKKKKITLAMTAR